MLSRKLMPVMLLSLAAASGIACTPTKCNDAVPVLNTRQALLSDAQLAVEQAERLVPILPFDVQETGRKLIATARESLRTASSVLALASTACSQPTVTEVFDEFIKVWARIRELIATVTSRTGASHGLPNFDDPIVFRQHGGG